MDSAILHHANSSYISKSDVNDPKSSISAEPVMIPKKAQQTQNLPEKGGTFRFLSGKNTSATTVFIGNISESSNDNLIRQVLQTIGKLVNWRRVQGGNGKMEPFGFAEYGDQEDALRALRLLSRTKVDDKTRRMLDIYENEQKEYYRSKLKPDDPSEDVQIEKSRQVQDLKVIKKIEEMLKGHIVFSTQSTSSASPSLLVNNNTKYKFGVPFSQSNQKDDSRNTDQNRFNRSGRRARRSRSRSQSDIDEVYEKRRQDRRRKLKEDSYQNRLKKWESLERSLQTEYEKRITRERRKESDQKERYKKMLEFLRDYDDDRDDIKHYSGNSLQSKLIERDYELEGDFRDIKREKDDSQISSIESEELSELETDPPEPSPITNDVFDSNISSSQNKDLKNINLVITEKHSNEDNIFENLHFSNYNPELSKPIGFGIKRPVEPPATNPTTGLDDIFVPDEIIEPQIIQKKIKLTIIDEKSKKAAPIEFGPESAKFLTPEERSKQIKKLVSEIPTQKKDIFAYDVKWYLVDQSFVNNRIKSWLTKKITEYFGEEEPSLIDYISQKIVAKCSPDVIQKDVAMIFDEETEIFIIKLWRLLIYETEAKSLGLTQDN